MARNTAGKGHSFKVADILPKGLDAKLVTDFSASSRSDQSNDQSAITPLSAKDDTSHSAFGGSDHSWKSKIDDVTLGSDGVIPVQALNSAVSSIFHENKFEMDGWAKPAFKSTGGGDGKGKPDRGSTTPDPVVTEETPTTSSDTPTSSPTTTPTIEPAHYVSGLDTPEGYNVELMFVGTWTEAAKSAAYTAAERISDIVTGDLPTYSGIDDIRITLTSTTIDGTGGTWGKGGYDSLRTDSKLAATGHVTIDSSDVPNALKLGLLDDLLEHEMLHAMGFGTAWSAMGLVDNYSGDLRFNGDKATQIYNTLFEALAVKDPLSAKGVPIETDGGTGSAGKHWDEVTFGDELMSTTLNYTNNTSLLTIAALEDMGYQTTFADSFLFA